MDTKAKIVILQLLLFLSLDIFSQSTLLSKDFIIAPRNNYAGIAGISSPVSGMMVYDTLSNCLRIYNGSTWDCVNATAPSTCASPFTYTQKGGGSGTYNDDDYISDIAKDADGNIFVVGAYQGNAVFGSTTLSPVGTFGSDIFLAKYKPDSTVAWAVRAGGANDDNGISVALDQQGNPYITGYFDSAADFYGTDAFTINKTGTSYDTFIAKYNTAGVLQSVFTLPANYGYGIVIDNSGNIYVGGEFQGTIQVNAINYTSAGGPEGYLAKVNSNGTVSWFLQLGSTGSDMINDLALDEATNKLFVAGNFQNTVNFGASSLTSAGNMDMFIARFNASTGANEWVIQGGGTNEDRAMALSIHNTTLYTTGWFQGPATFSGNTVNSNSNSRDAYIASYTTSSGSLNWIKSAGGSGTDLGYGISTDQNGNVFATGDFSGTAQFGLTSLISSGSSDVFMTKFNSNGDFLQSFKGGGSNVDTGRAIVVDNCGIYVAGSFEATATFGRPITSAAGGGTDTFLWKIQK